MDANNSTEVAALKQKLLSSSSANSLLAAGILLAQHDDLDAAAELFESCARLNPSSFEAKYNLVLARIGLTNYADALNVLNSIVPANTDQKSAVEYLAGKIFLATHHLKEAQAKLAEAYSQRPNEENYALDLALLYIQSGAYVKAIEVLRPSLIRHPESEELALELAIADVLTGSYADGVAICRKLENQDKGSPTPRLIAAFAYCAEKNYSACGTEASAGLAAPQPHPYFYYLRARAGWEIDQRNASKIIDDLSKATQSMPECGICWLLQSSVHEALHEDQAAIMDLEHAVKIDAEAASAWYRLAMLYRKLGKQAQASQALRRYQAVKADASKKEAENFRKQFLDAVAKSNR